MVSLTTEGIILNRKNYREIDLLVTFFSSDFGKLSGVAFGAKRSQKRFANCLELFHRSRIFFSERPNRTLVRIEMCELISPVTYISRDMKALAHASYLTELITSLTAARDQDKSNELFQLLDKCLELLESGAPPEDVARVFEVRFLTLLGYGLDFQKCALCSADCLEKASCRFNPSDGRLRCETCAQDKGYPLSGGTLKSLQYIQSQALEVAARVRFSGRSVEEARRVLEDVVVRLMQRRPKSLEYIQRLNSAT